MYLVWQFNWLLSFTLLAQVLLRPQMGPDNGASNLEVGVYEAGNPGKKSRNSTSKSHKQVYSEGTTSFYTSESSSFQSSASPVSGQIAESNQGWAGSSASHNMMASFPNNSTTALPSNIGSSGNPSSSHTDVKTELGPASELISPEKSRWGVDYVPKVPLKNYVVRPPPPIIPDLVLMTNDDPHPLPRCLWMLIFGYLSQSDLVHLSSVCRTFDCWALDPLLWPCINLSLKTISQTHLKFVMLRQPRSLKLASSVISYAQLSWLIARLPSLKLLDLSNLSWASICALCSSDCPLLQTLNLSWSTGIRDLCFRELASPPANLKPGQRSISRLCRLERLSLTGTDITDHSLEVIAAHLPKLAAIDLTCCMRVTDRGIRALVQLGAAQCHLREIRLVKCVQLTERCLESLASCKELRLLALTDIPAIPQDSCVRFARSYRHRTLRARGHGVIREWNRMMNDVWVRQSVVISVNEKKEHFIVCMKDVRISSIGCVYLSYTVREHCKKLLKRCKT